MDKKGFNVDEFQNVFDFPDSVFESLEKELEYLPVEQSRVCIYGKVYPIPRQLVAFGDTGLSYTFSGLTVPCKPWTPLLLQIKSIVEERCSCSFNFVLVNRYRDGNDCIGQHKDNEQDLLKDYPIASVSLGQERKMVFKRDGFKDICLELKNNSMIVMQPPTNKFWTHGIPRQREVDGVRLNLTFRKLIATNKRKHEDDVKTEKKKKDSKNSGAFTEIPKSMFSVGDDVFVAVTPYKGKTVLHIRRYKKYGKTYYPTKEGVMMTPWQFDHLFSRPIPLTLLDLEIALQMLFDDFQVQTTDFKHFVFTDTKSSKSITIMLNQWEKIKEYVDSILTTALDFMFRDINFKTIFEQIADNVIDDSLPCSFDVSNGTDYISNLLYKVMCDLMKETHGLIDPVRYDDDIIVDSNSVKNFNAAALYLNIKEIGIRFREELWTNQPFLTLPPAKYVTNDFLKDVAFDKFIIKAREEFCPPCDE